MYVLQLQLLRSDLLLPSFATRRDLRTAFGHTTHVLLELVLTISPSTQRPGVLDLHAMLCNALLNLDQNAHNSRSCSPRRMDQLSLQLALDDSHAREVEAYGPTCSRHCATRVHLLAALASKISSSRSGTMSLQDNVELYCRECRSA